MWDACLDGCVDERRLKSILCAREKYDKSIESTEKGNLLWKVAVVGQNGLDARICFSCSDRVGGVHGNSKIVGQEVSDDVWTKFTIYLSLC